MSLTPHNNFFSPIFIVGAPRSGTTLLAVLLDRHSELSIPPETQFYTEFLPLVDHKSPSSREEKVFNAINFKRIADLQLKKDELMAQFNKHKNTYSDLFRSILEVYALKHSKKRAGEKSPKHLEHVPLILDKIPNAKIICILRDGRDVVRSLLKVPWAEPGNKRRFGIFCTEWQECSELIIQYDKFIPQENFLLVKYEDLLVNSENTLQTICDFIGVQYEPTQLQTTNATGVVPEWESEWKNKASEGLDPSRAQPWRRQAPKEQVWAMNVMMGSTLKKIGYTDTDLNNCPVIKQAVLYLKKVPYLKIMRPFSLFSLKLFRICVNRN